MIERLTESTLKHIQKVRLAENWYKFTEEVCGIFSD